MRGVRLSLKIYFRASLGQGQARRNFWGQERLRGDAKHVSKWLDCTSLLKRALSDEHMFLLKRQQPFGAFHQNELNQKTKQDLLEITFRFGF